MEGLFARFLRVLPAAILALTLANSLAFAQHAAKGDNGVNGQQVAVDKQTGKLRQPTAEEAKQLLDGLTALVNTSTEGLTVVHHQNGAVSVDLQDRFMSVAVAKVGADGKIQEECVTSAAEAKQFLSGDTNDGKVKDNKAKVEVKQTAPVLEER